MRRRISLVLALAAVSALATGASANAATRLVGTVGPGFNISVKSATGKVVTALPHGTYVLVVNDRSSIHDFHLMGPGLNKIITAVGFTGSKTVTLTLKPGVYTYKCDPHSSSMHGSLRVR